MADPHPSSSTSRHSMPINSSNISSPLDKETPLQGPSQALSSPRKSHADFKTPYKAVARARLTTHLDGNPKFGEIIPENRHDFENFLALISNKAAALGVPDGPEITRAVHLIEQAKDIWGRALIHGVGLVKGVPFEQAVRNATLSATDAPISNNKTAMD